MSTFTVTRNRLINAAPEAIFEQVNNFHSWEAWSPWEKLDGPLEKTFGGPENGVGATYAWVGKKAGTGNMQITNSQVPSESTAGNITIDLHFVKPMKANNTTVFTFAAEGESTRVTWAMSGENKTLFSKIFSKVFNMDKMVGSDFEKGLASLAEVTE